VARRSEKNRGREDSEINQAGSERNNNPNLGIHLQAPRHSQKEGSAKKTQVTESRKGRLIFHKINYKTIGQSKKRGNLTEERRDD